MQFRGREMAHPELGSKILDDVLNVVGDYVKVETQARLEGRNMSMVLSPDKKALEPPKAPKPGSPAPDADVAAAQPTDDIVEASVPEPAPAVPAPEPS
jgi:translation initiation factor IF-3